jgi:hypothetical protein
MRIKVFVWTLAAAMFACGATMAQPPDFDPVAPKTEKATFLGVAISEVAPQVRKQLDLQAGLGLGVDHVMPESPAAAAGIEAGDVLTELDGQILVNPMQLRALVRIHKPGEKTKLTLFRDGAKKTIEVELAEGEMPVMEPGALRADALTAVVPFGAAQVDPMLRYNFVARAGDLSLSVTAREDGAQHIVLKDRDGKVLYEGPVPEKDVLEELLKDIDKKAKPGAAERRHDAVRLYLEALRNKPDTLLQAQPFLHKWPGNATIHMMAKERKPMRTVTVKTVHGLTVTKSMSMQERFIVKDAEGNVLYEGPAPAKEQPQDLPQHVRKAIETAMSIRMVWTADPFGAGEPQVEVEIKNQEP